MKNILLVLGLLILFTNNALSKETYICDKLQGFESFDKKPKPTNVLWSCKFIVNTETVDMICGEDDTPTTNVIIRNNEERIDFINIYVLTTELYTINKHNNQILYVKNGIMNKEGYNMMMKANCKKVY